MFNIKLIVTVLKKIPFSVPYGTIFLNNFPYLLLNPPKKKRKLLFRDCYRVSLKSLSQNLSSENLLRPMDYTALNIYSRVRVMRLS